ncbi:MAG: hypothetical protein JWN44_4944 [Myxococcales bacterium]|nr:hypothetical protein [Myxococcales bacterium]
MAPDKKNASRFQLWFEDAWEGWIRPLGLLMLLAFGYLLYKFEILNEQIAGILLVLAIIVGTLVVGALPALGLVRAPWQRALLVTMLACAFGGMVYPVVRTAVPGPTLAEGHLTSDKLTATLTTGKSGPYDVTVMGHFKEAGRSDAEADYSLKAVDNGGGSDEVSGAIKRSLHTYRSRKGSSTAVEEHTEITHRLPHVIGPTVTITAEGVDEQLEGGLTVQLRRGHFNPWLFIVLGALAMAMALVLDTRLVDLKGKQKAHLTAAVAVAFVFAVWYPTEATPHALVRPAITSFIPALAVGGLGGWLLGGIARLFFGPKPPKKAPRERER